MFLSALFIAFTSVFAQDPVLSVSPKSHDFVEKTFIKSASPVEIKDTFEFALDTANLPGPLQLTPKNSLDGVVFVADEVPGDEKLVRVSYTASKAVEGEDTIFVSAGTLADTLLVSLKVVELNPSLSADVSEWKPAAIKLLDGKAEAASGDITIVFSDVDLDVQIMGKDSKFTWVPADGSTPGTQIGKVTFSAEEGGKFEDTLLIADANGNIDPIKLALEVNVIVPTLTVTPDSWNASLTLVGGKAEAEKLIKIESSDLAAPITYEVVGDNKDNFVWNEANKLIAFSADAAGTYKAKLVVASEGVESKEVVMEIAVAAPAETPAIIVAPTEWKTTIQLENGKAEAERQFSIYGTNLKGELNIALKGMNPAFKWIAAEQLVKFSATVADTYKDSLIISSKDAETQRVYLEVKVENAPAQPVAVTGVTLDKSTATLKVGEELTLVATVAPANATDKAVVWKSSDAAVAEVASGKVTAKAEGAAVISVTTADGNFTAFCLVTVKKDETPGPGPVPSGDAFTLVTNASSLEAGLEILIVSTAKNVAAGEYTTSKNSNYFADAAVTISDNSITLADNSKASILTLGGSAGAWTLAMSDDKLVGATAEKKIALDDGTTTWAITIASNGDATIQNGTAGNGHFLYNVQSPRFTTYKSDATATMLLPQIYARKGGSTPTPSDPVAVTGVTLDKDKAEVEVGATIKLTATIAPANATNKKVVWSSDKPAIATVADGVVTGVAVGSAVITVKTEDGNFTASCAVNVSERETPPSPGEIIFEKVTTAPADWSGQYLIVQEANALAFNGKDATNNGVAATISGNTVTVADYEKYVVTIAKMDGGYSLQIDGKYIGGKLGNDGKPANGLAFSDTPILNTLALNSGEAEITSNQCIFLFNGATDQMRFRYFKAAGDPKVGVSLYKASGSITPVPAWVPDTISVAEAIEACKDEKTHYVDGIITEILTSESDLAQYGNLDFMLADLDAKSDAEIKCFRLYWKSANNKFKGGEVAVGDTVRVFGTTKIYTKDNVSTEQISDGYIVEILGKGDGSGPVGPGGDDPLGILEGQATFYGEAADGVFNFTIDLFSFAEWEEDGSPVGDGAWVSFDIFTSNEHAIAGSYSLAKGEGVVGGIGETYSGVMIVVGNDTTTAEFTSATVVITALGNNMYRVQYSVTTKDGKKYEGVIDNLEIYAYDEEGNDYELDEDAQGIENVTVELDKNAPMYNIMGQRVDGNATGIVIQNGHKFIIVR